MDDDWVDIAITNVLTSMQSGPLADRLNPWLTRDDSCLLWNVAAEDSQLISVKH